MAVADIIIAWGLAFSPPSKGLATPPNLGGQSRDPGKLLYYCLKNGCFAWKSTRFPFLAKVSVGACNSQYTYDLSTDTRCRWGVGNLLLPSKRFLFLTWQGAIVPRRSLTRLVKEHCPRFKGDERREAERSGGGLQMGRYFFQTFLKAWKKIITIVKKYYQQSDKKLSSLW